MNELHLFAGAGGGILAGQLIGNRCIGAVEIDPYAQQVLLARQRDGILPPFPVFSDVRSFDGRPYAGRADIVAGGFPCQDISAAGTGEGLDGVRSGLWTEMARVICEVRPLGVLVENSPMLTSRGLGKVLGDLAAMGFDAEWGVLGADSVGAPHQRERIWIVANAKGARLAQRQGSGRTQQRQSGLECAGLPQRWGGGLWPPEPRVGRVADGVAHRVDRIKAIGNGQVPRVAAAAWQILTETI